MIVNITVSLIDTVYMLHFYLTGKTLSYNQLKRYKTKVKMEKKKANDWMCQSQKVPSNDCEKAPN